MSGSVQLCVFGFCVVDFPEIRIWDVQADLQDAGAQHLKVSSSARAGAQKHGESFKHPHECLWGVFLAVLCAFALEKNTLDIPDFTAVMGILDPSA